MAQFAGSAHWAQLSPLFAHGVRPSPLNCENEHLLLALGAKSAAHAVVGSIVWAFRWLKDLGDERASAYAPNVPFFP